MQRSFKTSIIIGKRKLKIIKKTAIARKEKDKDKEIISEAILNGRFRIFCK